MNWITIITAILRLVGLIEQADKLVESYEARKRAQEDANVQASINRLSDDDVANELHKYDRRD